MRTCLPLPRVWSLVVAGGSYTKDLVFARRTQQLRLAREAAVGGTLAKRIEDLQLVVLRFGEEVHIAATVERIGKSSIAIRFDLTRASDRDHVATLRHVVAVTDLDAMRAHPIPDDVRSALEPWLAGA